MIPMRYAAIVVALTLTFVAVAPAVGAQCHPHCGETVQRTIDSLTSADPGVNLDTDKSLSPRASFEGSALP